MSMRETPTDAINGYVKAIRDYIIDPLLKNQSKLSLQREVRESKRFTEMDTKIKDYIIAYDKFRDSFFLRDNVLEALRKIQAKRVATRMTNFLEKAKEITVEESEEVQVALVPYMNILKPVDELKKIQTTLMNQARIKKMTLPYDEITTTLNEVTAMVNKMPGILMDGIYTLSENLEQVA